MKVRNAIIKKGKIIYTSELFDSNVKLKPLSKKAERAAYEVMARNDAWADSVDIDFPEVEVILNKKDRIVLIEDEDAALFTVYA